MMSSEDEEVFNPFVEEDEDTELSDICNTTTTSKKEHSCTRHILSKVWKHKGVIMGQVALISSKIIILLSRIPQIHQLLKTMY